MKIPERVVAAARNASGVSAWIGHDDMRAAITAALEEWIASGEASLKYGAFTPNGGYHYTSLTDDRSHPVLIIRMEQK